MQPITSNSCTIKDSFAFAEWIRQYQDTGTHNILCSFDVKSLFTNVPITETIDICINRLQRVGPLPMPEKHLRKLLEFSTKKSHFLFNGKMYDFVDGIAMGSPLAPVLANIFMTDFEEKFILSKSLSYAPHTWRRYVDDTFCIFSSRSDAQKFLHYLNGCHPNIDFTVEFQNDDKTLPFLDILISKKTTILPLPCIEKVLSQVFIQNGTRSPPESIRSILYEH